MDKKVIIIGAGGHGKVIGDIVEKSGDVLLGYLDSDKEPGEVVYKNYNVIGTLSECIDFQTKDSDIEFFIAIGANAVRQRIAKEYKLNKYYTAIHPSAIIASDVEVKAGTSIMAKVVINASAKIGEQCIINTSSVIEHDCIVSDYSHVSSGVIMCGGSIIENEAYVGAGSIIKRNAIVKFQDKICEGTVVEKIDEGV